MSGIKYTEERRLIAFRNKYDIAESGCWLWKGALVNGRGLSYGQFYNGTKSELAHRFSYRKTIGEIPVGLTIDHLCRNTRCVNPKHLEVVTNRENIMRGEGVTARNARKTHCNKGHEFTPENTIYGVNDRECRTCRKVLNTQKHKKASRARNLAKEALREMGETA